MPKDASGPTQKSILRQKAEKLHSERPRKEQPRDLASLVHEPGVHQIELEIQNAELRRSQLEAVRPRSEGEHDEPERS